MQAIEARPSAIPTNNEEQATYKLYEHLCVSLYSYRLGTVSFLELLKTFEESLGLPSPPQTPIRRRND
ncbi:MAG: hypothetical protein ACRDIV_03360 [Ktedonobacteraceae bacterium]